MFTLRADMSFRRSTPARKDYAFTRQLIFLALLVYADTSLPPASMLAMRADGECATQKSRVTYMRKICFFFRIERAAVASARVLCQRRMLRPALIC